jgi:hypothetical protein
MKENLCPCHGLRISMDVFNFINKILKTVYTNFEFSTNGILITYCILVGLFHIYVISVEGIRVLSQNYIIVLSTILATTFVVISFNQSITKKIMQNYSLVLWVTISCCLIGITNSLITLILTYTSGFNDNNLLFIFYFATYVTIIPLWAIIRIIVIYLTEISRT